MRPSAEFIAQHHALTRAAGFARLDRTILTLRGADRIALLHSFCTNDIKQLQPGAGCEAFITSPQGKTLGHVFVVCQSDELMLNTTSNQAAVLIAHLNRFIISEDVEIIDCSSRYTTLLIGGPLAAGALQGLSNFAISSTMLQALSGAFGGTEALLCRVPYTGEHSFFLQLPAEDSTRVEQALQQAGATFCDPSAVESARLEAGFPLFGVDITADNLPQEVRRDKEAISFLKGCYLGQETVARLDAIGHVNRRLVGLRLGSEVIPDPSTTLQVGDKTVGQVTSSAWSPRLQGPLALAYVRTAHANAGTELTSLAGAATVISLPLVA